jgi:hypothetical protein
MADVKTIQTRLQLKYDTFANWTDETQVGLGANLVLLKGEIGICEISSGNTEAQTAPTVLFKVGDGTNPFKSLKWASALAADVYSWAKSETVVFDEIIETDDEGKETGRKHFIRFKSGDTVVKELDLSTFITDAEVNAIVGGIETRLANIEAALGVEDGAEGDSVIKQISDITDRLDVIEGEGEGSIAQALTEAKDYTDEKLGTAAVGTEGTEGYVAATGIRKEIADVEANAKSYTDAAVSAINTKDSEQDTAIGNEVKAREDADKAITNMIGTGFDTTETGTVAAKVKAAHDAANAADGKAVAAQSAVNALVAADGQVTTNTADIAQLKTDLADEKTARETADSGLNTRLQKVEAFFEGAYAEDGQSLNAALDTLVEIQSLLSTEEGAAAGELLDAITSLEEIVGTPADGENEATGLVKDMADAKVDIANLKDDVVTLQDITDGYTDKGSIKTAIDAAATLAQKGVDNAATAQAAAEAADSKAVDAQTRVGTLETTVPGIKTTAEDAQSRVAALEPKVEQAEKDIDALEAIVATGDNSNDNLRTAITDLETIVEDDAKGNEALYTEVTRIAGLVDDEETGIVATNEIAVQVAKDVAALEPRVKANEDAIVEITKEGGTIDIAKQAAITAAAADASSKVAEALSEAKTHANNLNTAMDTRVGTLETDVAEIKGDYLKAADVYVFNCGSSTAVTHTVPATPAN